MRAVLLRFAVVVSLCSPASNCFAQVGNPPSLGDCAILGEDKRFCPPVSEVVCPAGLCTGLQEGGNVVYYCLDENQAVVSEATSESDVTKFGKVAIAATPDTPGAGPKEWDFVFCFTRADCNCVPFDGDIICVMDSTSLDEQSVIDDVIETERCPETGGGIGL